MTTSRSSVENKFGLRAATATSGLGKQTNKKRRLETDIISGIFWLVDAAQLKSCNYNKNVQIVGYAFLHFMGVICSLQ